jgi:hypothetical protein
MEHDAIVQWARKELVLRIHIGFNVLPGSAKLYQGDRMIGNCANHKQRKAQSDTVHLIPVAVCSILIILVISAFFVYVSEPRQSGVPTIVLTSDQCIQANSVPKISSVSQQSNGSCTFTFSNPIRNNILVTGIYLTSNGKTILSFDNPRYVLPKSSGANVTFSFVIPNDTNFEKGALLGFQISFENEQFVSGTLSLS